MAFNEAKELAAGRLHVIFVDSYSAFENQVLELLKECRWKR
ncbi:hypothetical protein [Halomonas sp.]